MARCAATRTPCARPACVTGSKTAGFIERLEIEAVTVRRQPGVWTLDPDGYKNGLVWDENGITYSIWSNRLPLEELQKIAESLGK